MLPSIRCVSQRHLCCCRSHDCASLALRCNVVADAWLMHALQAQSKLEGVLSGIGGADGGEPLEWELPSEEDEEEAVQPSELRSTEEWKQYVATYGQSYTERYFASYYHSQVSLILDPSLSCSLFCSSAVFALFAALTLCRCCPCMAPLPPSTISGRMDSPLIICSKIDAALD